MVGKGCEGCRKWQEHYYWEHMDVRKIRFYKLMTGDFARVIGIPEKFVRNFNGQIAEGLDLKVPSGKTWHVSVDKHDDELFLMSGWEDFVKAYELQENDLLLFTCSGNSSFEVLIFGASGCEKVSSLFCNKSSPNMRKYFDDMVGQGQHAEHYSLNYSEDTTTPSQLFGSPHCASTSKNYGGKEPREQPQSPISSNDYAFHEVTGEEESAERYAKYYFSRFADRLADEEKEDIFSMASVQVDNPAFVTVLQAGHVRQRSNLLTIPVRFVADHLDSRLREITLHRPNRKEKWCVKYCYSGNAWGIRNNRFSMFVSENKLREGDICIFELMKGARQLTMTVHVIRKADDQFVLVG